MNKTEKKPQEEAKTQDKSQNQPKESFIGTGNGSSSALVQAHGSSARYAMRRRPRRMETINW